MEILKWSSKKDTNVKDTGHTVTDIIQAQVCLNHVVASKGAVRRLILLGPYQRK